MKKIVAKYNTTHNAHASGSSGQTEPSPVTQSHTHPQTGTPLGTHAVRPSLTMTTTHSHQSVKPISTKSVAAITGPGQNMNNNTVTAKSSQPRPANTRVEVSKPQPQQMVKQASIELPQQTQPSPRHHQHQSVSSTQKVSSTDSIQRLINKTDTNKFKDSLCCDSQEEMFFQEQYIKVTGNSVDSQNNNATSGGQSKERQAKVATTSAGGQAVKKQGQKSSSGGVPVIGFQINKAGGQQTGQAARIMSPKAAGVNSKIADFTKQQVQTPQQKFSHSELMPSQANDPSQHYNASAPQYGTSNKQQHSTKPDPPKNNNISLQRNKLQISTFLQGTKPSQPAHSNQKFSTKQASTDEYLVKSTQQLGSIGEYHPSTTTNAVASANKMTKISMMTQSAQQLQQRKAFGGVVKPQMVRNFGGVKKQGGSQKRQSDSSYSSSDGGDIAENNYFKQPSQSPQNFTQALPVSAPQKFSGGRTSPIKSSLVVESIQYPPSLPHSSINAGSPTLRSSDHQSHTSSAHKNQQAKDRNKNQVMLEYLKKKPQSAKKEGGSSLTPAKAHPTASITQLPYEQPHKRLSSLHHQAQRKPVVKKGKKKTASIVKSILIPHHSSTASGGHCPTQATTQHTNNLNVNEPIVPLQMSSKQKYSKTFHIPSSSHATNSSQQLAGSTKNTSSALQLMLAHVGVLKSPTDNQMPKKNLQQKFTQVVMPSKKSAEPSHKRLLTEAQQQAGGLSERVSKTSVAKPKQSLKPPNNHIQARRISLTQKKQSMLSMPHSLTLSTENLQHHRGIHKPLIEQKRASNTSMQSNLMPRRKFANSLVSVPQQVSPLSQVSYQGTQTKAAHVPLSVEKSNLKVFARSLLSSASNSTKNFNLNQVLMQSKQQPSSAEKVSVSNSPNSRKAIQLVSVKFQQPKLSLIGTTSANGGVTAENTTTTATISKAKSFVQGQIARESPGPGALIASSNRISIVDTKTSTEQQHPMTKVAPPDALIVPSNLPAPQPQPIQSNPVSSQPKTSNFKQTPYHPSTAKHTYSATKKQTSLFQKPQPLKDQQFKYNSSSSLIFNKKPKNQSQFSNTVIGSSKLPQQPQRGTTASLAARSQSDLKPTTLQAPSEPQSQPADRLDTHTSTATDLQHLSPKTRIIAKLQKKIRINFQKLNQPPETQCDNYKIGKVMGKGAFGKVNLAIHRLSGKFVALKSINKQYMTEEASKRKVMQEFNILQRTRHGNIVKLYESFETAQHIVFVIEVCGGGDLLTYVRRRRKLREDIACHLFRQIIIGLQYCHSKNVLHRDIKLDNILLTSQGTVKICDFGVSKLIQKPRELMFEQCGTPAYIAPEVFENKGYVGYQSDVWSAGVVLYAMLYGTVPFKASNMSELHKQVVKNKPDYKEGNDCVSPKALQLLNGILEKDPVKRLTPQQILDHPWMTQLKANKVNVFSQSEKETIMQEFELYNQKKERFTQDEPDQHLPTDPFAEQLLVSTQNSGLKNVSSRSVILAPFNSTISDDVHITENRKQMKELLAPRKAIKFIGKLVELNRQYELNNNAELDNGVYHQEEADEADGESSGGAARNDITGQSINGNDGGLPSVNNQEMQNLATGFGQQQLQSQLGELMPPDSSDSMGDEDACSKLISGQILLTPQQKRDEQLLHPSSGNNLAMSQNSEWKQLQQQMIGSQQPKGAKRKTSSDLSFEEVKVELVDDEQGHPNAAQQQESERQNKQAIEQIQNCGYPHAFIMESLRAEHLNHVTAFYNLVTSQFEY